VCTRNTPESSVCQSKAVPSVLHQVQSHPLGGLGADPGQAAQRARQTVQAGKRFVAGCTIAIGCVSKTGDMRMLYTSGEEIALPNFHRFIHMTGAGGHRTLPMLAAAHDDPHRSITKTEILALLG